MSILNHDPNGSYVLHPNEAHLADRYSPAGAILKSNYALKIMQLLLYAATYGITLLQDYLLLSTINK